VFSRKLCLSHRGSPSHGLMLHMGSVGATPRFTWRGTPQQVDPAPPSAAPS
jgi:hypothetical protein